MPKRFEFFRPKKPKQKQVGPSFSKRYGGKSWAATRKRVLARDNWQCVKCKRVCSDKWEAQVDHIVRKEVSNDDSEDNLQTLCFRCHGQKSLGEKLALRGEPQPATIGVPGGSVVRVLSNEPSAPAAPPCVRLQNSEGGLSEESP